MVELLFAVIIFLAILLIIVVVLLLKSRKTDSGTEYLQRDLAELRRDISGLSESVNKTMTDNLDKSRQSVHRQFEASSRLINDVSARLTKLDETNKRVVDVTAELKTLQNTLQNPKQRGVLGEYYLEQVLKNILPPNSFALQHKIAPGLVVDAVIKLEDKILPIDSKFSLENYNRLLEADEKERPALEKKFKEDLKRRIDETAKYIQPGKGTLDQALMFIPSEAIYYDLLSNKIGLAGTSQRDLMQYAAADKRVTIVGPSTLAAMLGVIVQGLRSVEIHKDTEKIRKNIEQLSKHLLSHQSYMVKLGDSLSTTVNRYNDTFKELGKVDKDIVKITDSEAQIEPVVLKRPEGR